MQERVSHLSLFVLKNILHSFYLLLTCLVPQIITHFRNVIFLKLIVFVDYSKPSWLDSNSCGMFRWVCRVFDFLKRKSCRSSGVEHSIGNGEVDSSNLSGSTTFRNDSVWIQCLQTEWSPSNGKFLPKCLPNPTSNSLLIQSVVLKYF